MKIEIQTCDFVLFYNVIQKIIWLESGTEEIRIYWRWNPDRKFHRHFRVSSKRSKDLKRMLPDTWTHIPNLIGMKLSKQELIIPRALELEQYIKAYA